MEHFASVLRPRGQRPGADLTLTSPGEAEKARRFHSGLPGGGKGAVTAGQRFQGTLSLGQIDLGLGQVPGCLLVVGPGLSKGLPGFIQPFCFVPGDGVEKAHGPLGFQGGHLLFRGLPGLPAGFRLDGEAEKYRMYETSESASLKYRGETGRDKVSVPARSVVTLVSGGI